MLNPWLSTILPWAAVVLNVDLELLSIDKKCTQSPVKQPSDHKPTGFTILIYRIEQR